MRTVRWLLVVKLPPAFNEHIRLGAAAEPFAVQQLVAKFAVEAFDEAVLPWAAGGDSFWKNCILQSTGIDIF